MHYWAIKAALGRRTLLSFSLALCSVSKGGCDGQGAGAPRCLAASLARPGLRCGATVACGALVRGWWHSWAPSASQPFLQRARERSQWCWHQRVPGEKMGRGSAGCLGDSTPPAGGCCAGIRSSGQGFGSNGRWS